ncbi:nickel pincer cofactor biosynthesis protein LarB [Sinanaerobacter sp. ZZT-01]|uniref:nickel pincer cofactor biosynthesis protein LarB n=1 Tax=Sinanaerobacter sp. ZZT-01 TaxID=3111540 RepID=UPI002D7772B4|nr:nickel pincer cofactor biosynthesis protein LarB [Sinanaerobacter sp. ZZT-01]WRR94100.1 nickel pincer cofactor biosynthesis protein LarB [Sinanaerobacter sp. ZZT-01]
MDHSYLINILNQVASGEKEPADAAEELKTLPFEDLGFSMIDQHRNLRTGYPEAIFCEGKTPQQVAEIVRHMMLHNTNILATRASQSHYDAIRQFTQDATYHESARIIVIKQAEIIYSEKTIAVITAGTADIPVAEEAAITAETLGNQVDRIYDVGVAGIHRLLSKIKQIRNANVIIVVAGMEGALASVIGGLVDKPVIAVPTSIGYGASFGGISALLTMLNSCAAGVGVVNIDNGFGAAYLASNINRL